MVEIVEAYTRSGHEWCTCCQKQDNTKRIKFSQDGRQGMSVVLCDDCRRELVRCLSESEDKEKLSWLGKNCKDCGNEKCKKLGTLPKGYDCALWQPESEKIK